jgi:hypothetical protein
VFVLSALANLQRILILITRLLCSSMLRLQAMEALVDAGLVKVILASVVVFCIDSFFNQQNIGISNFNSQLIYDLLTYARLVDDCACL